MSNLARTALAAALQRMQMSPVLVEPSQLQSIANVARLTMTADGDEMKDMTPEAMASVFDTMCQAYGFSGTSSEKSFAFSEGTAIIPIHGSLINRFGGYWHGHMTGYQFIRRQTAMAMADPDVERIIYDVNSPGGEAAGCFELADELFEMRGTKPTLAVVDASCYSAAYALSSSVDKIVVTPSGGAGSIGVISMHADLSKLLDDFGVKITLITAGKHKADGNPFNELSPEVKARIQADVDDARGDFVALVARNRGIDQKAVMDTEASCYTAKDALELNLIDAVDTPAKAVAAFINGPAGSTTEGETMTPEEIAQAKQEAAAAERTRMAGIVGCEAAKGKSTLANHLAFNTSMSVEEAGQILAASPLEAAATAAPTNTTAENKTTVVTTQGKDANTNFLNAMNQGKSPELGADTDTTAEELDDNQKALNALDAGLVACGVVIDKK